MKLLKCKQCPSSKRWLAPSLLQSQSLSSGVVRPHDVDRRSMECEECLQK